MTKWIGGVLLLAASVSPLSAQHIDPDWCWTCKDSREHFVSGAAIDVGLQVAASKWSPALRVAAVAALGVAYEAGQADIGRDMHGPGYGFGPKDLVLDVAGAVVAEFCGWAVRRLF